MTVRKHSCDCLQVGSTLPPRTADLSKEEVNDEEDGNNCKDERTDDNAEGKDDQDGNEVDESEGDNGLDMESEYSYGQASLGLQTWPVPHTMRRVLPIRTAQHVKNVSLSGGMSDETKRTHLGRLPSLNLVEPGTNQVPPLRIRVRVLDQKGDRDVGAPLAYFNDDDIQAHETIPLSPGSFPPGVPMPPTQCLPAEFECQLCYQKKRIHQPSGWTKHVHEDVGPFTCTWYKCRDPDMFKRKADWLRHENEGHRHLEWWTCDVKDCRHTCYRKDNFLQHLVREHKFLEPKTKTKGAMKRAGSLEPTWQKVEECHQETTDRPQGEPCKFCGHVFPTWKKLLKHLANHMEQIALPILRLVDIKAKNIDRDTIISPFQGPPTRHILSLPGDQGLGIASGQIKRQSGAILQIQTLCGLAGITPSTRELENWNGAVMFEDNTVALVTYAHQDVSRVVSRVTDVLGLFLNALHCAQSVGLCCQSFTIFQQETSRSNTTKDAVFNLHRIDFSMVKAVFDEIGSIIVRENAIVTDTSATVALLADIFPGKPFFPDSGDGDALEYLQICCLSAQILTIGFLAYIQAHAGPLHPYFLDTPTTKIKLFGVNSLSGQPTIEVTLRELTCLGDMLQSPVLVFGMTESLTKLGRVTSSEWKYDVLASAEDVIDTWGPAQFIVPPSDHSKKVYSSSSSTSSNAMLPSAIKICGGVIFMAEQASKRFHWSKQASAEEFCHGFLDPTLKIRIGSPVAVNESCKLDAKQCRTHAMSLGFLWPLGTSAPAWMLAEKQVGVQAGQYAIVQANAAYHRFPGRTLKQYRLEQGDEELVPFLDDCWAVQVSLCTGVARRVPLREMVADLLPVFARNLTFRDDYDNWVHLVEDTGITEAFRSRDLRPWLRTLSRPHHDLVLHMVRRVLHALSETGLDREGKSLLVSWPYDDDTRQCFSIDLGQRQSSWARLVADCEDSAIFVYASPHCLETAEFRCRGLETCPWRNVIPLLETTVMISNATAAAAAGATVNLVGGDRLTHKETYYFKKLGDVHFVRAEQQDAKAVVKLVRKSSSIPDRFKQRLFSKAQLLRERDKSAETGSVAWLMADF